VQEEYDREQISWSFIEFPDNQVSQGTEFISSTPDAHVMVWLWAMLLVQECLELMEHKTQGILALLDEQVRVDGFNGMRLCCGTDDGNILFT